MLLVDQFIIFAAKLCIGGVAGSTLGVAVSYGAIFTGLV